MNDTGTPATQPPGANPPPVAAASVIVLRQGPTGLEVLLMCRQERLAVHSGAYVFPGGKVEPGDSLDANLIEQHGTARLAESLGEPELRDEDALALYVAAIRETWEEAGILPGARLPPDGPVPPVRDAASFRRALQGLGPYPLDGLVPWSRWITPAASFTSTRRFDTRFFVCELPADQEVRHCEAECSGSIWVRPQEAIEDYWRGTIMLLPPQIMTLLHLAHYPDVGSALAEARARRPYVIRPNPLQQAGVRVVAYPGDPLHDEKDRVMPGPTRLYFRDGRYALG
jgi:8-oxo-dGTP pyrophosphatase MutT (NUDIX family)